MIARPQTIQQAIERTRRRAAGKISRQEQTLAVQAGSGSFRDWQQQEWKLLRRLQDAMFQSIAEHER